MIRSYLGVLSRLVRFSLPLMCTLLFLVPAAAAQQAAINGTVVDSINGEPVVGMRIEAFHGGSIVATAATDRAGRFVLDLAAGDYTLILTRLGYRPEQIDDVSVAAGSTVALTVRVEQQALVINPVVASASRREEKALDAPASVSVVDTRAIVQRSAPTPIDHVSNVTGVVVAKTGLTQAEVVTRGFNNVS